MKLTKNFYIKYGLDEEDIDDMPAPLKPVGGENEAPEEYMSVRYDKPRRGLFGAKKKLYS